MFIDWVHYVGRPKTPRTSLLAMEQAWFEVRASRRACMRMKVSIEQSLPIKHMHFYPLIHV